MTIDSVHDGRGARSLRLVRRPQVDRVGPTHSPGDDDTRIVRR